MSSMGDLGRHFERFEEGPAPIHPATELDELGARLDAFLEWGRGRPDRVIRDRFIAEFAPITLRDGFVEAINAGRGGEVRAAISGLLRDSPRY
ncbi:MAG: hypothetical protein QOE62_3479 [Actinomycetota bacterium]|jgi:hypothetical protein|nr:hypothetical protein [Actinomycetota bacterium]